jgi:hypothetical protein
MDTIADSADAGLTGGYHDMQRPACSFIITVLTNEPTRM